MFEFREKICNLLTDNLIFKDSSFVAVYAFLYFRHAFTDIGPFHEDRNIFPSKIRLG